MRKIGCTDELASIARTCKAHVQRWSTWIARGPPLRHTCLWFRERPVPGRLGFSPWNRSGIMESWYWNHVGSVFFPL
ncbi:hypothetical protein AGOR_G00222980 [Albula goreensis]|uniref:Uncharacterized protein n=1 Tax=Albula goreensis TaxID=1534307 RepID=A0A8T3CMW6_9TELE|nr:hypothetical protein AGOR_G00222980 [Albula goreensis]